MLPKQQNNKKVPASTTNLIFPEEFLTPHSSALVVECLCFSMMSLYVKIQLFIYSNI